MRQQQSWRVTCRWLKTTQPPLFLHQQQQQHPPHRVMEERETSYPYRSANPCIAVSGTCSACQDTTWAGPVPKVHSPRKTLSTWHEGNNWAAPKTAGPVSLQDNVQWFATNWKPKLGTAGCSSTSRLVQTTNAMLNGSLQPDTAACPSWAP
jgi:hypothetical protein